MRTFKVSYNPEGLLKNAFFSHEVVNRKCLPKERLTYKTENSRDNM